ncbi:MAG: hypothetical protein Cons2KO_22050 [Congregibacter sp.]
MHEPNPASAAKRPASSKSAGLLALVVVVGYFAFEVSNLHRLKYRTEPAFILDEFASAHFAATACPITDAKQISNFDRNYAHVKRNALADAQSAESNDASSAETRVTTIIEAAQRRVAKLLEDEGCNGKELRRLQKLHQIRARLSLN